MSREMRGHGNVYQRGNTWWLQYSLRGQVYRESAHSDDRKAALKLLKQRIGETSRGRVGPVAEKVTLAEMKEALLTDYRLRGNRRSRPPNTSPATWWPISARRRERWISRPIESPAMPR
jgi:hypothetical protein